MSRRFAVLSVLLVSGALFACTDASRPISPEELATRAISVEVTSLASNHAKEGVSFSLNADVVLNASGETDVRGVSYGDLSSRQQSNLAHELSERRFQGDRQIPAANSFDLGATDAEPLFKQRSVSRRDAEGNLIRYTTLRAPRPGTGSGPVGASLIFRNDTLQAIIEFIDPENQAPGMRLISVSPDGTPLRVTEIRPTGLNLSSARLDGVPFLARALDTCGRLLRKLGPAPAYAQEEECMDAEMEMYFAASAYVAAEYVMLQACKVPGSPCIAAIGALGAAAAYLTWKTAQYWECVDEYNNPDPPDESPQMRASDSFYATETDCYYIDWEISYDGGVTWEYWGRTIHCG